MKNWIWTGGSWEGGEPVGLPADEDMFVWLAWTSGSPGPLGCQRVAHARTLLRAIRASHRGKPVDWGWTPAEEPPPHPWETP